MQKQQGATACKVLCEYKYLSQTPGVFTVWQLRAEATALTLEGPGPLKVTTAVPGEHSGFQRKWLESSPSQSKAALGILEANGGAFGQGTFRVASAMKQGPHTLSRLLGPATLSSTC